MGRARGKLTIKHLQNEKARKSAFNQRTKGLAKKVSEFSSKFGVEACLIVYDDDGRPMTWPQDSTLVESMLKNYEHQKIEATPNEFNIKDYFENRKSMVEAEISKVRKLIANNKYPTWGPCFQNMDAEQLKAFTAVINDRIEACNQRISMLKSMNQGDQTSPMNDTPQRKHILNHDHLKQVYDVSGMVEMQYSSVDPLKPLDDIINETVDFTNHVSLPPVSSTNKIGEVVDLDDLMVEPEEWANQLGEFVEMDDLVAEEWNTQLINFDDCDNQQKNDWINQLINFDDCDNQQKNDWINQQINFDDCDNQQENDWINQPEVFEWQDISFLSQNVQQGTTLDAFLQSR